MLELPLGKTTSTTMVTASKSTPLSVPATSPVLQSLTMLAQSSLVRAGIPLPDPDSVIAYRPDTTAAVLDKSTQKQPISDLIDTSIDTSHILPVPKLCDLSYSVVSCHNLLDLSSTPTGQMGKINSTVDKKDPDIIVLGEAHILDYDKYLHTVAASNKSKVVLAKLTRREVRNQTSRVPHWSQLDPYSSLEESSSVTEESEHSSDTKAMKMVQSRYQLHERT